MKYQLKFLGIPCLLMGFAPIVLESAVTFRNGRIVDAEFVATMPVEEHYNAGIAAIATENWQEVARQFTIVATEFCDSPYAQEALFYAGVGHYYIKEYDQANESFSAYLQGKNHPRLFEEAIEFKYTIAERFREGARARLLGSKKLPKWGSGDTLALQIYEEVIAAVPCHEMAVQSLCSKGVLHWSRQEFKEAVNCFQMIIKRFPKHELAPESYLIINKIYLDQCRKEFQNPDILAFAEINLQRFELNFPKEERLEEARCGVSAIKEVYSLGLYETGQFYERLGRPEAAAIYYQNSMRQFPGTEAACLSSMRLTALGIEQE